LQDRHSLNFLLSGTRQRSRRVEGGDVGLHHTSCRQNLCRQNLWQSQENFVNTFAGTGLASSGCSPEYAWHGYSMSAVSNPGEPVGGVQERPQRAFGCRHRARVGFLAIPGGCVGVTVAGNDEVPFPERFFRPNRRSSSRKETALTGTIRERMAAERLDDVSNKSPIYDHMSATC
jgi:hypothetical protein